jgi:hypothetical protein
VRFGGPAGLGAAYRLPAVLGPPGLPPFAPRSGGLAGRRGVRLGAAEHPPTEQPAPSGTGRGRWLAGTRPGVAGAEITGAEVAALLTGLAQVLDPAQLVAGDLVTSSASLALAAILAHSLDSSFTSSAAVPRTSRRSRGSRSATARSAPCPVGR